MNYFRRELFKADGRKLFLYSRAPLAEDFSAPSPKGAPTEVNPHLRWHPLRGEWVAYAGYRQNRTFLPPKEYNPLRPMSNADFPTELPEGNYEIAVFENMFPTFTAKAHGAPSLFVPTQPAAGVCEVVVFTQDPNSSLGALPLGQIKLLLEVWAERYVELGRLPHIKYVMPFENKGVEMGVTLNHPHGQIYAYPVVPPIPAHEQALNDEHFKKTGHSILEDLLAAELKSEERLIYAGSDFLVFVPVCARYPYETWIVPRKRYPSLDSLDDAERTDLARALKTILLKYDGLWQRPFPYLMLLYQAPTNSGPVDGAHFHFELIPPYRSRDRLKFLAGTELGAGLFANDSLPEEKALELRKVEVSLE